jgi:hypothetical protein
MVRILILFIFVLFAGIACNVDDAAPGRTPVSNNGSEGPPVTPVERPLSVPEDALEVTENTMLGEIERSANQPPNGIDTRALLTAGCQDDVIVLFTDAENIHASLPCDRFWSDETVSAFSSQEVAIDLTVDSQRFQIFIETLDGGQAEFTVGGIWIE